MKFKKRIEIISNTNKIGSLIFEIIIILISGQVSTLIINNQVARGRTGAGSIF